MARITKEQIICDICQSEGERYTLSFPGGIKVLDRCSKHDRKILALKNEPGEWTVIQQDGHRKGRIKLVTPDDIQKKRKTD
jgi:hypothetical protein